MRALYTPAEAARLLGYSRAAVYRYIQEGLMDTERDERGHMRITEEDMAVFRRRVPNAKREQLLRQRRRREVARAGGLATAARYTPEEMTRRLQEGKRHALIRQVDPDGRLPADELERRVEAARLAQLERARAARGKSSGTGERR